MPTYDYQCKQCGHSFEAFHSMTAESLKKCPECGADALERKIGLGAGIVFKGSGFYGTDYKKSAAPSTSEGSGSSDSTTTSPTTEAPKTKACGKPSCGCH